MEDPSNSVIVVPDATQRQFVIRELRERFEEGEKSKMWYEDHVITWGHHDRALRGRKRRRVLIDNLDMILNLEFSGHEVNMVTMDGATI
jgi:hypothetical protein